MEAAGIDGTSLSVTAKLALRHIATCPSHIVDGVGELLSAARDAGYDEGFYESASLADDDEDDDLFADDDRPPL